MPQLIAPDNKMRHQEFRPELYGVKILKENIDHNDHKKAKFNLKAPDNKMRHQEFRPQLYGVKNLKENINHNDHQHLNKVTKTP